MRLDQWPGDWVLPPAILYVNASRDAATKADFVRQLRVVSRRSRADGAGAWMTLFGDPDLPRVDDVCPSLAWLARLARRQPMPRLLYVADIADLATGRRALLSTFEDLFGADLAVRPCGGLISATGRRHHGIRSDFAMRRTDIPRGAPTTPIRRSARPRALCIPREP